MNFLYEIIYSLAYPVICPNLDCIPIANSTSSYSGHLNIIITGLITHTGFNILVYWLFSMVHTDSYPLFINER